MPPQKTLVVSYERENWRRQGGNHVLPIFFEQKRVCLRKDKTGKRKKSARENRLAFISRGKFMAEPVFLIEGVVSRYSQKERAKNISI